MPARRHLHDAPCGRGAGTGRRSLAGLDAAGHADGAERPPRARPWPRKNEAGSPRAAPARAAEAAVQHGAERPRLARQRSPSARVVDVRDLEQREVVAPPRPRCGASASSRLGRSSGAGGRARSRAGSRPRRIVRRGSSGARPRRSGRVRRHERGVTASVRPAPRHASTTARRTRWLGVRPPPRARRRAATAPCSRPWMRATSSTTSISRVTSSQRGVGTRTSQPSPARAARSRAGRGSRPPRASETSIAGDRARRRSMRTRSARARRQVAVDVDRARAPCARRRARRAGGPRRARRPGARCGSTPFSQRFEPSVRRPSACEVRMTCARVKFAASSTIVRRARRRSRSRRRP